MRKKILFIGGPSSGKSNYLFRCWISIEREIGLLSKDGLPADLEYLRTGAASLLEGRFAPHTSRDEATACTIPVATRSPRTPAELIVPDMSGELWLDLYEKREWPLVWDEYLTPASGFILFLRANSPHDVPALDWLTCERYYRDRPVPQPQNVVPTQVLMVDWLQIVRRELTRKVGANCVPRLSVVVSAWDSARAATTGGPADFISLRYPLLSDFLRSASHGFHARIFGASVASGDLDSDQDYRTLYISGDPAQSGYSVPGDSSGRDRPEDALLPIYWAIGVE